jgi:signal transduction histidine kinase
MRPSLAKPRRLQIGFAVLLVVCVAQVGWWMIDQWHFSAAVEERSTGLYRQSLAAAKLLLDRGVPVETVEALFPGIVAAPDGGGVRIDPEILAGFADEHWSRINRYAWEGGFFLVVLVAAIGVLWSAVRAETRLRRRQSNFVTAGTHELKSPLAAMRLAAETLDFRDPDPETRGVLIRRLLTSLDRMESTVANVLDTARIDAGRLTLAPDDVELAQTVETLLETLATTAQSRGVSLEMQIPAGIRVRADPQALIAVLRNLIDNALAAVTGAEAPAIVVSASVDGGSALIEVRDNGRGFAPTAADKLFEKFYRPGDEMRREGRGTGLGLYIARYLASQAGATLTAHSEGPGRGARFLARWPLAAQSETSGEARG